MRLQSIHACLFSTALAVSAKVSTIWIAGDSTTAPDGGHNGTEGWGQYLKYSFGDRALVNNSAYAGRSARSVCVDIFCAVALL
jgi:rhamnogalacturonan acetylesterase